MPNPAERVRQRMRHWMDVTKSGQRDFARDLGKTQVWLQKVLNGENHVRLRDLDRIAEVMRTTAAELVRDEDARYAIEATPTELRLIERVRHKPGLMDAIAILLDIRPPQRPPTSPARPDTNRLRGVP